MLLVVAPERDDAARRFVDFAATSGVPAEWMRHERVKLTSISDRRGRVTTKLTCSGEPVTAILNRGADGPDDPFRFAEWTAAWWSVLATFDGPVVNRPSRNGLVPHLDVWQLATRLPGGVTPVVIADGMPAQDEPTRPTNVHRLNPRAFVGRLGDRGLSLTDAVFHAFTPVDPSNTRHILVVGHEVLDLSTQPARTPSDIATLMPIVDELRGIGAVFVLLVVEDRPGGLQLIHVDVFPGPKQYSHVETQVHAALLEFLRA